MFRLYESAKAPFYRPTYAIFSTPTLHANHIAAFDTMIDNIHLFGISQEPETYDDMTADDSTLLFLIRITRCASLCYV